VVSNRLLVLTSEFRCLVPLRWQSGAVELVNADGND